MLIPTQALVGEGAVWGVVQGAEFGLKVGLWRKCSDHRYRLWPARNPTYNIVSNI
jgi:hypothetical protein